MWSQWPWVRDDELERPVAGRELVGDPGERRVAVSIAIASRDARVGEDVDVRRDRADDAMRRSIESVGRRRGASASSFVFMQSKVWPIILLAVPSISRAPTLASVPAMLTSAVQSMTSSPSGPSERRISAVASTALPGRLAVGLDQRPVRRRPARRTPC